ncbi:hypothetical protein JW711_01060 [Candidatus Woesearchaeota archaeon]|nr:hypothetical protein [Candidatus Woesearchaeota archaeon]
MKLKDIIALQEEVERFVAEKRVQMEAIVNDDIDSQVISTVSAFECMIDCEVLKERGIKVVYASSPITTGLLMYMEMERHGVHSLEELKVLKPDFMKDLMARNIEDGKQFGREILSHKYPLIIVPGSFYNHNFTQQHYMGVWEPIVREKSDIVAFNTNFHYSNGCVQEFFISLHAGKEMRSRDGFKVLNPKEEFSKIERAMTHVCHITGSTPAELHNWYQKIKGIL